MAQKTSRRDTIVSIARARMLLQGYEGTTIGQIADDLGASKAAVSYYFPTKDSILDELVEPFLGELESVVAKCSEIDWPSGVGEALNEYLGVLIDQIEVARWLDTDVALRSEHRFGERLAALSDQLVAAITNGSSDPVDQVMALTVIGGLWRPVLELEPDVLREHRAAQLEAALASYPAVKAPSGD